MTRNICITVLLVGAAAIASLLHAQTVTESRPGRPSPANPARPSSPVVEPEFQNGFSALYWDPGTSRTLVQRERELNQTARGLLAEYSNANDDLKKQQLAEKLSAVVTEQFDVAQQIREAQLVELENRVKRLRELHDRRNAAKSTIVQKRIRQLIDEAEGLGWSASGLESGRWPAGEYRRPSTGILSRPIIDDKPSGETNSE